MKSSHFTKGAPFPENFERRIFGSGKDNIVRVMPSHPEAVVKIPVFADDKDTIEGTMNQLRYKQRKYNILRRFLGDFVPESIFVLGKKNERVQNPERTVGYTIQQRVPDIRLSDLDQVQRRDPRLVSNTADFLSRLRSMYLALGEVNARTGDDVNPLDGKLDLGGASDLVRHSIERDFDPAEVQALLTDETDFLSSPNICVDPETMQIWCVDFDKGEWDDGKELAYDYIMAKDIGGVAVHRP